MNKKTIGILGCGWLGLALGKQLIIDGYTVKGTVRKNDRLAALKATGIDAYILDLKEDKLYGDLADFLKDLDILFINIPPGLRKNPESDFAQRLKLLMLFVNTTTTINKVIFVSSTSVFEDMENIPSYNENSIPNSTSNNGKKIYEAEQIIQELFKNTIILRPCGLIGNGRNPIKMLTRRKKVKNPDAPVNLVTREHVIDLIRKVINGQIKDPIIHAISEPHEVRKNYYSKKAIEFNLLAPEFEENNISIGKKIMSLYSERISS